MKHHSLCGFTVGGWGAGKFSQSFNRERYFLRTVEDKFKNAFTNNILISFIKTVNSMK